MAIYHIHTMGTNTLVPEGDLTNEARIGDNYRGLDQYTLVGDGAVSGLHGSHWCQFYAEVVGGFHAPEDCSLYDCRRWWLDTSIPTDELARLTQTRIETALQHTAAQVAAQESKTQPSATTTAPLPVSTYANTALVNRLRTLVIPPLTDPDTDNSIHTMLRTMVYYHAFRCLTHPAVGLTNAFQIKVSYNDAGRGSQSSYAHGSEWCRFYHAVTAQPGVAGHAPEACSLALVRNTIDGHLLRPVQYYEEVTRDILVDLAHDPEPTETKSEAKTEVVASITHRERVIRIARRAIDRLVTDSTQHGCYLSQVIRFHAWRHSPEGGNYYDNREAFLTERNVRASIIGWSYSTTRESVHGSDWCRFYNDCVAVRSHGSTACQSTAFREWYNNVDLNADDLTRIVLPYLREAVNFVFSTEVPPAQASPVEPIPIETKTAPLAATSAAPTETKQSETWPRDRLVKVAQHAHNHPVNAYTEHLNTAHAIDQATTFHLFHCATVHADRNASDWTSTNFIKDTLEWIYYSEELPAEGSDWCRFYRQVFGPAQAPRLCNCNSINHAKYWIRRYTMSTDDMAGRIHATLEAAWNATSPIQPLVEDETKAIPMEVDSEPAVEDPPEAPGPPIDVDVTEVVSSDVDRARLVAVARAVNTTRLQRSYDAQTRRFLKRIAVYHAFRCIEPGRGLRSLDDESEIKRTYNSLRTDTHRCHHGSDWCEFYQDVTPPERNAAAGTHRARQCSISGIWVNMGTCTLSTTQLVHLTAGILRRALADTASNGPSAAPTAVASS